MGRLAALLAIAVAAAGCNGVSAVSSKVDSVATGDLVVLRSGERLRLAHIEAPPEGAEGWEDSKAVLERIVKDKQIQINRIGEDADGAIIADLVIEGVSASKVMLIMNAAKPRDRRPVSKRR
ncbi:MAG: hypothetical protein JW909_12325 [Planctomycetes bacterium]|nr:hypothetical protein [Planctomycetota bacterium]